MSEWRKIGANGLSNEGRSPKSGHRMAAEGIQFPWRLGGAGDFHEFGWRRPDGVVSAPTRSMPVIDGLLDESGLRKVMSEQLWADIRCRAPSDQP